MIDKVSAILIGVVAVLLLVMALCIGYIWGQGDLCSDLGGVFIDSSCLNRGILLDVP